MDNNRLTKKIFEQDWAVCKLNWASEMKQVFSKLGCDHIYRNKSVCNIDLVKDKVKGLFTEEWVRDVNTKPKLRHYTTFKENTDAEDYVQYCQNRHTRCILSQFRCGPTYQSRNWAFPKNAN